MIKIPKNLEIVIEVMIISIVSIDKKPFLDAAFEKGESNLDEEEMERSEKKPFDFKMRVKEVNGKMAKFKLWIRNVSGQD